MSESAPSRDTDGWSAAASAKGLLRVARRGALATLDPPAGAPYASLVGIASDFSGAPLLLLSRLARHTRNLDADPRASVLLASDGAKDPLANARLSVQGRLTRTEDPAARRRYLARHPEAAGYAAFADFSLFRLAIESGHLVAGFGRIVDLEAASLLAEVGGAAALLEAEPGIAEHMNEDHADAVLIYATRLLGAEPGPWRFEGCDPEGCELRLGGKVLRLPFDRPATSPTEMRLRLVELAQRARAST